MQRLRYCKVYKCRWLRQLSSATIWLECFMLNYCYCTPMTALQYGSTPTSYNFKGNLKIAEMLRAKGGKVELHVSPANDLTCGITAMHTPLSNGMEWILSCDWSRFPPTDISCMIDFLHWYIVHDWFPPLIYPAWLISSTVQDGDKYWLCWLVFFPRPMLLSRSRIEYFDADILLCVHSPSDSL
jgi:hypothetical protein